MTFFEFHLEGNLSGMLARVQKAREELPDVVEHAMDEAGQEIVKGLEDAAPLGIGRTGGHLKNSFSAEDLDMSVLIFTDQPEKLHWVRYGTETPILPVVKRALYWPELGHPIAWVHGQDANDFVTPVLDQALQYLEDQIPWLGAALVLTLDP